MYRTLKKKQNDLFSFLRKSYSCLPSTEAVKTAIQSHKSAWRDIVWNPNPVLLH